MDTTKKPTMEHSNIRPRRLPNVHMIQNFHLVWLDESIDEFNDLDRRNSITNLQQIVSTVNTFTDLDECIDFITDVNDQNAFIIVSHELSQIIIPVVQDISQVSGVYIFYRNEIQNEEWMQQWSKVKGVYADITSICETLKKATQNCDHNSVSISFIKTIDGTSGQNLDTFGQAFMYTQILKEILLTIDFKQSHIHEFLTYYRAELAENTSELKNIDMIEKEYHQHEPIWWYTYPNFLYSMVNKALRLMEVDLIIKIGFFIRDLHQHIDKLHAEQFSDPNKSNSFTVYRGQGLSQTVLEQLKKTQGGLMSFNNFLSTSLDRAVSLIFAESNQYNSDLIGVLFVINIDSSTPSSPFANISCASYFQGEEEVLFSMHSVFRIDQVNQIDENIRLWQVDLTLTSDNDPELHNLTKSIQEETRGSTGWHRLGQLTLKLGHCNKAEELCNILLEQTNGEDEKEHLYYMLGSVYDKKREYSKALSFYEKALEIREKTLPANPPDLATSYNNIGLMYCKMGEHSKALSCLEKAVKIQQKAVPANHPNLATSYNNIGLVYYNVGDYSKALSYHEKALEIRKKALPANNPGLAISYDKIGMVYYNMGDYSKSLSFYEKALEIRKKALPANNPGLAISYDKIGMVYYNMGDYSKSLSFYEKALEIRQKTLPTYHPDSAISCNNIGVVYYNTREYSKALLYLEKALEIRQKTLPTYHPDLAISYNNIGVVYDNMGEYSKALLFYEKALEIVHKTLPVNHPLLAISYNNIGLVYYNMGEYSKALSFYEKALETLEKTFPENHPNLASSYNNIGLVYDHMREYSKALSFYKKALEIFEKTLPENHLDLSSSYNNIGLLYSKMEEYSKALSYYDDALKIFQGSLSHSHHLEIVKQNIEIIKKIEGNAHHANSLAFF